MPADDHLNGLNQLSNWTNCWRLAVSLESRTVNIESRKRPALPFDSTLFNQYKSVFASRPHSFWCVVSDASMVDIEIGSISVYRIVS